MSLPAARAGRAEDSLTTVTLPGLVALAGPARGLALRVRRARARLAGGFMSPLRGRGMEFDEVRPYQPGDDIRTMEWRITARTGRPHTKLFREERERPVLLVVDLCGSMFFATRGRFKAVVAAEAAALIAWSAEQHGDRVGGLVFSESCHREVEPRRSRSAVLHYLEQLVDHPAWQERARGASDPQPFRSALQRLARVARPGSLIVLASDFRRLDAEGEGVLRMLAAGSDLMLLMVNDPFERELPPPGVYRLTDGALDLRLATALPGARARYREAFEARRERLRTLARARRMSFVPCDTAENVLPMLQRALGVR